MTSAIKKIVFLGASGNLGPSVVSHLSSAGFTVKVLVRPSSKATVPAGVELVKIDYNRDNLLEQFKGQDAVVSTLNPVAQEEQKLAIDIAAELGLKRFIPSEFGADTSNEKVAEMIPILAPKRAIIEHAKTKQDKVPWTAVLTGPFADWGIQTGFLGFNVPSKTAQIYDTGNTAVSQTSLTQVGRALVKIFENPDITANQYVHVESYTATQNDMLATLEKLTGSKFDVTKLDSKAIIADAKEKLAKHDYSVIVPLLAAGSFHPDGLTDWTKWNGSWNERLGLPKENIEDVIKKAIA